MLKKRPEEKKKTKPAHDVKLAKRVKNEYGEGYDDEGSESGYEAYEVEAIVGKRLKSGRTEYLLKWKGHSIEDASWEPKSTLQGSKEIERLIRDYELDAENITDDGGKRKLRRGSGNRATGNRRRRRQGESSDDEPGLKSPVPGKGGKQGVSLNDQYAELTKKPGKKDDEIPEEEKDMKISSDQGHFMFHDEPESITFSRAETNLHNDVLLLFTITWKPRSNGIIPKQTEFTNKELKKQNPVLLAQYYETKVRFGPAGLKNPVGWKKEVQGQNSLANPSRTIWNMQK